MSLLHQSESECRLATGQVADDFWRSICQAHAAASASLAADGIHE
jgi:hypothetical protein